MTTDETARPFPKTTTRHDTWTSRYCSGEYWFIHSRGSASVYKIHGSQVIATGLDTQDLWAVFDEVAARHPLSRIPAIVNQTTCPERTADTDRHNYEFMADFYSSAVRAFYGTAMRTVF